MVGLIDDLIQFVIYLFSCSLLALVASHVHSLPSFKVLVVPNFFHHIILDFMLIVKTYFFSCIYIKRKCH